MFEGGFFARDIKAVDKALEIIEQFNQRGNIDQTIKLNIPAVWKFDEGA